MNDAAQRAVNTDALKIAVEALTKINEHNAICSNRWELALKLLLAVLGGVISTLCTVLWFLLKLQLHGIVGR